MAIVKKISDKEFTEFERELLSVLREDPDHKIVFDKSKKMTVHSSNLKCNIIISDVHLDDKTGNLVLVGAFRSGQPVMDKSVRYPKMMNYVSIPFREAFNDLRATSGLENKLLDNTRGAILDKYITPTLNSLETRHLFDKGRLNVSEPGMGHFLLPNEEMIAITKSEEEKRHDNLKILDLTKLGLGHFLLPNEEVIAVTRDEEKRDFVILKGNNPENNYHMLMSRLGLMDMWYFGRQLSSIQTKISEGMETFTGKMKELQPDSMTRTERENKEHQEAALMAVYETGLPLPLCNSVARIMADSDMFDEKVHSRKDIVKKVTAYRKSKKNPEKGIKTSYVNSL